MRRALTIVAGLGFGVVSMSGIASAQVQDPLQNPTVTSDGATAVASDDPGAQSNVVGEGTDIVVGDLSTGGTGGEVLGDPNAIYYPDLSAVPSVGGQPHTPTIVGLPIGNPSSGDMIDGIDVVFTVEPAMTTAAAPVTEAAPVQTVDPAAVPVDDEAGVPVE